MQEFIFEQLGVNGYRKGMSIKSQSDGTVRLLTLIPAFYKAMKQHGVVVIDEIENSMFQITEEGRYAILKNARITFPGQNDPKCSSF